MSSNRFLESYLDWFHKLNDDEKYTLYHGYGRFTSELDLRFMRDTKISWQDYKLLVREKGNESLLAEIKTYVLDILNEPPPKIKGCRKSIMKKPRGVQIDGEPEIEFI